jgi:CRP-like cAMP-binding protein
MIDQFNLVKNTTLLKSLSPGQIESYIRDRTFRVCTYGKNSIIHFSGEVCSKLEIILSGDVMIERIDESGGVITIAEFCNNEILGGNLLFSKNPYYPLTITTKQPTVILEIKKDRLFNLFCQNQGCLRCYLEYVSDHATILSNRIKQYMNKTIRESVISYLKSEQKKQNSKCIKLSMSKKALAETIGVQRTSLSRELAKMRKDGLINYDAKSIELLSDCGTVVV